MNFHIILFAVISIILWFRVLDSIMGYLSSVKFLFNEESGESDKKYKYIIICPMLNEQKNGPQFFNHIFKVASKDESLLAVVAANTDRELEILEKLRNYRAAIVDDIYKNKNIVFLAKK